MSKTEEKTTELMKKAKDFIPDGGYSEKELNLAFFMFIKGYQQAEKDLKLTWKDMALVCKIEFLICTEYKRGKLPRRELFYQEILKRFKSYKERKKK